MRWTTILAAAGVIAAGSQAYALDDTPDTPDTTRIVSDPLYLPLEGQIYGQSAYRWSSASDDVFDATGARAASVQSTGNSLAQQFQYGISDDLALRLDWGYDWRSVSRHDVTGTDILRSASGWTDPSFGVTWRAIDQRDGGPFSLDLRADYSPDAFPSKSATADDEGTIARGGQGVDLGATIGHQTRDFTIAALFDANYFDGRKTVNTTTGGFSTTDALWNYTLGLESQLRLDDAASINAGIGHTFANNATVFNSNTGLTHISTGGDFTDLSVAFNYHFVPNTLVGSVGYQHNFYDDSRNLFPASPADNTAVRNKGEDVVGVTMRYVLN
ncbi:MAG TPA: hypothetical protein VG889_11230 [Rhizomicrobium sp.]|nr:hypothetical protein [Rhizomicrobium sp.]